MSDGTNGLRFDVYERIHLPDDVAAIDELEEIELVPRIQVIDQGEYAVLKGQLLLSGVYRGQNVSDAPLSLEHWIPVEITLPMNRVTRLDDISIEIDNFDVDLLSARTLNITGVLSLRGIAVESVEDPEESWRSEPFTAVHQREAVIDPPAEEFVRLPELSEQPYIQDGGPEGEQYVIYEQQFAAPVDERNEEQDAQAEEQQDEQAAQYGEQLVEQEEPFEEQLLQDEAARETPASVFVSGSSSNTEYGWSASIFSAASPAYEEEQAAQASVEPSPSSELQQLRPSALQQEEEQEQQEQIAIIAEEQAEERIPTAILEQEDIVQPQIAPPPQEPPPLKVAFSGKDADREAEGNNVGFVSLLASSKREQAARQAAELVAAEEKAEEQARTAQPTSDDIEWKSLFLNKGADDNEFRKIKVCIVQKDETLELIALRYSLNPREIISYNKLNDTDLSEGQLLYIP